MVDLHTIQAAAADFVDSRSNLELAGLSVVTATVLLVTYAIWRVAARSPPVKNGPKWYWFWGSSTEFMNNFDRIHEWLLECTEKYGKWKQAWGGAMVSVGQFRGGMICLVTPEEVRHMLKDNFENYEKGEMVVEVLGDFLGNGIFTSDGEAWKVHRKVAAHMFSRKLLIDGTEVAIDQAAKLVSLLDAKAASGESIDIQPAFYAFTMDTFCSIAFGIELNSQEKQHQFSKSFDLVQELCARRFQNPFWTYQKMFQLGNESTITKHVKLMDKFASDVIEHKRRVVKDKSEPLGVDLVTRFLQNAERNNKTLTTQELRDVVINFIIAGRDTTASGLSWCIYELCRNPEIGDIIRNELEQFLPAGKELLDLPKKEAFHILSTGLVETKAVVMEVLRLHPSVAIDLKLAINDDVLPTGVKVPRGATVVYTPFAMGRNPEIWPNPEKFDHTRFLQKRDNANNATPTNRKGKRVSVHRPTSVSDFKYPVFNAGPRLCLGRPLAVLEMQLMLCILVTRYDFKPSKPHLPKAKVTVVAANENGVPVYVTRRN